MDIPLVNQTVEMMNPVVQQEEIQQPIVREASKPFKKQKVASILKNRGLSNNAVAGIMGNIDVETGGSFDYQEQEKSSTKKPLGYGLFQLTKSGPLPKGYIQFLEKNKIEDSAEAQIDFMLDTIYGDSQDIIGRGNAAKLRKSFEEGDAKKVAEDFMNIWERPGIPHKKRRLESAESILGMMGEE